MNSALIFETFLAPARYKNYLHFTEYVERYADVPTFLLNGESLDDFAASYADVGFINTLSYIQLLSQKPCPVDLIAVPVLQDVSQQSVVSGLFDVIVHKESALYEISDVKFCTWAYHRGNTHIEDKFMYEKSIPASCFKATVETRSQAQSLRYILTRQADATAIDACLMDIILHNSSQMAVQLRVIGTYSYSIAPLIVVANHVSLAAKLKIQEAFLNISSDPFYSKYLQEEGICGFVPVTNKRYQCMHERNWNLENCEPTFSLKAELPISASFP